MMIAALTWVARHGRWGLVLGLLAGLALPGVAAWMRPMLPEMVAGLLFLTALRIGPRRAFGSLADLRATLGIVVLYQFCVPLVVLLGFGMVGVAGTAVALVVVLTMAAPSVTGAPNFAILLGHAPAPALRLLVIGTALFPLTVLPVFWALPALGSAAAAFAAAGKLMLVIGLAVGAGFALRAMLPEPSERQLRALDGASVIALAVIVVALMAALGPALRETPMLVAGWMALAMAMNLGAQALAYWGWRGRMNDPASISISAGNRNIALFLVALPPEITNPLLIFIGCYQVPMYLTPILMRHVYGQGNAYV